MLLSLWGNCCGILFKNLSYQQHVMWLFLLVVFMNQQNCNAEETKWNHSIQRRFMWKQMDSTVDGFVDRVVTGARVMKSMIGEFMPPKQRSSNAMDYLPTETTNIKYIIRNPHTKETKVIRVRPSKKVVKLMAMTPKPLMAEKPKPMYLVEHEQSADKFKPMYIKETDHMTNKFKPMFFMDPDKLRQLEKEQELIAEGRLPITREQKPVYMTYKTEKSKDVDSNFHTGDDIVSGRIQEFNESWRPVYKLGDTPSGFTTSKPYMMSALHTSVVGELLPEPQKQIYEPLTSNNFPDEEPKKTHTYEVTEYTAEESVVQPYTHEYFNHQSPTVLQSSQTAESPLKYFPSSTETPNIVTQIEDNSATKAYNSEYRTQRGFLPFRGSYTKNMETSSTTTTPITTTTTEEPNYPEIFLKKFRNRPNSNYNPKGQQRSKLTDTSLEIGWLPSNVSFVSQKVRQIPHHHQLTSADWPLRTKSQKWPPDVEDTYLNSEPSLAYFASSTTEVPVLQEFKTQSILNDSNLRKNVRLKKSPQYSSFTETKHRSARHRGSVKYGDRLEIEER